LNPLAGESFFLQPVGVSCITQMSRDLALGSSRLGSSGTGDCGFAHAALLIQHSNNHESRNRLFAIARFHDFVAVSA
jgi:hypothetical protein